MIRGMLEWLAWKVIGDHVRDHYILRANVADYCWWMGKDFPVFHDAMRYLLFLDDKGNPVAGRDILPNHRQKMRAKYIGATHES